MEVQRSSKPYAARFKIYRWLNRGTWYKYHYITQYSEGVYWARNDYRKVCKQSGELSFKKMEEYKSFYPSYRIEKVERMIDIVYYPKVKYEFSGYWHYIGEYVGSSFPRRLFMTTFKPNPVGSEEKAREIIERQKKRDKELEILKQEIIKI